MIGTFCELHVSLTEVVSVKGDWFQGRTCDIDIWVSAFFEHRLWLSSWGSDMSML
jgi:hypothetical protein